MAKTVASYTIMDLNDAITLIPKISANHPQTLAYDPSSGGYNPDWSSIPLTLTPSAVIAGRTTDVIPFASNKIWEYRRSGETEWSTITNGVNGFSINASSVLGYSSNNLFDSSHSTVEFQFSFTYHDDTVNLDFPCSITTTFARISNGTSVVLARAWSQDGEQFKNKKTPSSLTLQAELIRGIISDTTHLTYQWQKLSGGVWTNITSATDPEYIVLPNAVDGSAQFRCLIHDSDSSSDTYNETFTSNGILILDLTDPYQAVITSSNGSFIKNGAGETVLTCNVYQDGVEITSGLTYKWLKSGSSTVLSTSKTLTVTSDMIDVKANFTCEVS